MNTIWFLLIMLEPALLQFTSPTKASGWRSARQEREGTVTTDGMRHPPSYWLQPADYRLEEPRLDQSCELAVFAAAAAGDNLVSSRAR